MENNKLLQNFIEKARKVHGNKYDYLKVNYINSQTKVCIICPEHGEFQQLPEAHLRGQGCKKCAHILLTNNLKYNTEEWVEKARKVHGDKYDYSKVEYVNSKTKVCIICPEHGEFWQLPSSHLTGRSCPLCANYQKKKKHLSNINEFIEKAKKVHGNKYNYSKTEYINSQTKVCIICPEHGEFWQTPNNHLMGSGCQKCYDICRGQKQRSTTEEFIKKAKRIHGNKYDYSQTNYININTKICIICPIHGIFWQRPDSHLSNEGCPHCRESKLEKTIKKLLTENDVLFERQKRFPEWLGKQSLDFYLPDHNIAIECQGEQHFKPIKLYGGEKEFEHRKILDEEKLKKCTKHKITILYFSNRKINKENYFNNTTHLLNKIKETK